MITYQLSHTRLSHPISVDSEVERTPQALIAWVSMYLMRNLGAVLERSGWTVEEVGRRG